MRSPGADTKYIYAVARMRVLETRLLDDNAFERLLEEPDPAGALRVLAEFGQYARVSEALKENSMFEDIFFNEIGSIYDFINGLVYDKSLVRPFFKKRDILKGALQRPAEGFDHLIWKAFRENWKGNLFLNEYVRMAIDLENIKIFFRTKILGRDAGFLKSSLIEGGNVKGADFLKLFEEPDEIIFSRIGFHRYDKSLITPLEEYMTTGKLSALEKACDDILISYIRRAKYFHFGVEPLISYILAKENEIKNLRIILIGRKNGFKVEETRPILRISYA